LEFNLEMKDKLSKWLNKDISLRRKSKTPSRWVRKTGKVAWYIVLLAACVFAVWRVLLYRDVERQFARIRAAGYSTSGAELNAWRRPVPDTENGALMMDQAFSLMRTFSDKRSNQVVEPLILSRTNQWSGATLELVEAYVQTNLLALAESRKAVRSSQYLYPLDFSYGPGTELPHLRKLKELARVAALQAALQAEQGQSNSWPENVTLQLKLAATLEAEPIVISFLLRNAIIRMAVTTTERSLNHSSLSDEAGQRLQAAFALAIKTNQLPLALAGDRAVMIPTFRLSQGEIQNISGDETSESKPPKQRFSGKAVPFVWFTGFFERDLDFYLKTMDQCISLAALSPPQSLALTNYMEAASSNAQRGLFLLSGLLLPSFKKIIIRDLAARAAVETATTALAVEQFRHARERLPDKLEELVPQFLAAIPTDPFDGAPLRYRRLANGYIIYSIDADGHDDGGKEAPERRKSGDNATYDITFIVEH
jgi:hypothetical protein